MLIGTYTLQRIGQKLVHLRDLRGHTQINCPISNLNHKATDDIRVDLIEA